jgi:hypothetical protein
MNMADTPALHGKPVAQTAIAEGYKSPEEYADQGDTRIIRDVLFGYLVEVQDVSGNSFLEPRDARRNDVVSIDQIGLLALEKGERHHSFYTSAELERMKTTGSPAAPVEAGANLSELGEFELAEWLSTPNPETGKEPTINEVLERVGDDKDLAQRMLAAENVRSSDDPRKGLEQGLTVIIEGD